MAARILVVEDNEAFRNTIRDGLKLAGFTVETANDAKTARDLVTAAPPDLVISDIRMPGMSGIELLHHIKNTTQVPVILMTGFSELAEAKEAADLGAVGFLAKPFRMSELKDLISGCLKPDEAAEPEDVEAKYAKLNIDDFISGSTIQFDIYIRLSAVKFLKVVNKGEEVPLDQIRAYKAKSVGFLHVLREDLRSYLGFNLRLVKAAKNVASIVKEKKANLIKHAGSVVLENLTVNGIDAENYAFAKSFVETALDAAGDDEALLHLMLSLQNQEGGSQFAHAVAVSTIGVMIARKLGWSGGQTLFRISMAGLLHDIGLKEIPPEVLAKKRFEWTESEVRLYESHAMRGMELLSQIQSIPEDVLQVVLQHHEDCVGEGYPSGLTKERIHPLARLISLADEFSEMTLATSTNPPVDPLIALKRIAQLKGERLDTQYLVALMALFGMAPPPELSQMKGRRATAAGRSNA